MATFDFKKAWKKVEALERQNRPRSLVEIISRIERAAIACNLWPEATRAFIKRVKAEGIYVEEDFSNDPEGLLHLAKTIEALPQPMQAVLQLYLAHVYFEHSRQTRWGGSRPTRLSGNAAETLPPWSREKINETLEKLFEKILAQSDALKAESFIDWTDIFTHGDFPPECCPTLYDFVILDIVDFYGKTIPDKTLEKGLSLYGNLLDFHHDDGNDDAVAFARFLRAAYINAFDAKPEKEREAEFNAFLDGFIEEYRGKTPAAASAAVCRTNQYRHEGCYAAAHRLAAEFAERYPLTPCGLICADILGCLERKELDITVERNWCAPWPEMEVTACNVDDVYFKLVPVSFDELVRDESMGAKHGGPQNELKGKYFLRESVKTWSEHLSYKEEFDEEKFTFSVPSDIPCGHYVLYASASESFSSIGSPLFAQYVTVTPLALAVDSSDGKFEGFVCDAESGKPVSGARVELWTRYWTTSSDSTIPALKETRKTDAEGRFSIRPRFDNAQKYLRAVKDGCEVLSCGHIHPETYRKGRRRLNRLSLFTDRSIYRPGQEIKIKGLAYNVNPGNRNCYVHERRVVDVSLIDPNGKEIDRASPLTNAWGSFVHTFKIPLGRLTGRYKIEARAVFSCSAVICDEWIQVEEYKRPKFKVEFDTASSDAALGKSTVLTGRALTYSGLPVQNAEVEWKIERRTRYPYWWSWFGSGAGTDEDEDNFVADGICRTDKDGIFKIGFIPAAAPTADLSGEPAFDFSVRATVTDETGESHSADSVLEIGTAAWQADLDIVGEWHTPESPIPVAVTVTSLTGTPVPVRGVLRVMKLNGPDRPVRKELMSPEWFYDRGGSGDWKRWKTGEEVLSVTANAETAETWKTDFTLEAGAYRILFETKDPDGKTIKEFSHVCVFDPAAGRFALPVPDFLVVADGEVRVGETLRAFWASGYETGWCRVKVTNNGKTVLEKLVGADGPKWLFEFPVKDEHRGRIRIETTFVRENRLYRHEETVEVPWDNKFLKITTECLRTKLIPGQKEKWTFRLSGPAEVLAFMYDRSLDAYRRHGIAFDIAGMLTPDPGCPLRYRLQNAPESLSVLSGGFPDNRSLLGCGNPELPGWEDFDRSDDFAGVPRFCACIRSARGGDMDMDFLLDSDECPDMPAREAPDVPPRKNLEETAFFLPALETGKDGRVTFSFTVPDALTGWKFILLAHDTKLNSAICRNDSIVTTKPLMCEPAAPRFVHEGDEMFFPVKVTNTESVGQTGLVTLDVTDAAGKHRFDIAPQPFDLEPNASRTFFFRLFVPDVCSSDLGYVARASGAEFTDGEEGSLPVLPRRILVREALPLHVRGGKSKSFRLENLLASGASGTLRHRELSVNAVSRPAWYAVLSLPYLMEFPHECCEQTFSRYYANALANHIRSSDPRIAAVFDEWKSSKATALNSPLECGKTTKTATLESTPWLGNAEHETAARRHLGGLFDHRHLEKEQNRCLEMLTEHRNADNLWPWFPGGDTSIRISLYILCGFARLNRLTGAEFPEFFAPAIRALDEVIASEMNTRSKRTKENRRNISIGSSDVRWLYLHSFPEVPSANNPEDIKRIAKSLMRTWRELSLSDQARAAVALFRLGEKRVARKIALSIRERAVVSDEKGMYWKVPHFFSTGIFSAPVSTQTAIIEAFYEVTGDIEAVEECKIWLLLQKESQDWTTTAATADAVHALILGEGKDLLAGNGLAEVSLGGERVSAADAEAGTGMYSRIYPAERISPEMGNIVFSGTNLPNTAWGSVSWSYFEDVLKVRSHEPKELNIKKKYFKKVSGAEGTRLVEVAGAFKPGDEIVSRLEISSDRTYEFVHLEDRRPACAEPVDVISSYRWQDGVGYYKSTRDTATHYYIDRLNAGTFVLETSYRISQRGDFAGGIATLQCMYAPRFTAHSDAQPVSVASS